MITISVYTAESAEAAKFDVQPDRVAEYVQRLACADEVLVFTPRSGNGTVYIPARQVTYMSVSEDHNAADPSH